jgi:hypothetical protein
MLTSTKSLAKNGILIFFINMARAKRHRDRERQRIMSSLGQERCKDQE